MCSTVFLIHDTLPVGAFVVTALDSTSNQGGDTMRPLLTIAGLLLLSMTAYPQARKSCKELKAEITKKIEANGTGTYSLEIVPKEKQAEGAVVGFCDGGTKKIVYLRASTPPPQPSAPKPTKP